MIGADRAGAADFVPAFGIDVGRDQVDERIGVTFMLVSWRGISHSHWHASQASAEATVATWAWRHRAGEAAGCCWTRSPTDAAELRHNLFGQPAWGPWADTSARGRGTSRKFSAGWRQSTGRSSARRGSRASRNPKARRQYPGARKKTRSGFPASTR